MPSDGLFVGAWNLVRQYVQEERAAGRAPSMLVVFGREPELKRYTERTDQPLLNGHTGRSLYAPDARDILDVMRKPGGGYRDGALAFATDGRDAWAYDAPVFVRETEPVEPAVAELVRRIKGYVEPDEAEFGGRHRAGVWASRLEGGFAISVSPAGTIIPFIDGRVVCRYVEPEAAAAAALGLHVYESVPPLPGREEQPAPPGGGVLAGAKKKAGEWLNLRDLVTDAYA